MGIQDIINVDKQKFTIPEIRLLKKYLDSHISISKNSERDYLKKFFRITRYSNYDLIKYTKDKQLNKSSYYCYKAAYQYGMTLHLGRILKYYNKYSREKDKDNALAARKTAIACCKALIRCNCDYKITHVHDTEHNSSFPGESTGTKSRKINSKRKSIVGLPGNWQEKIYKNISSKYKLALLVLILTGCRPHEIFKGVTLSMSERLIQADIIGSKVSDTKGYMKRSLFFDPDISFASQKIKDILISLGSITVNLGNKSLDDPDKFRDRFYKAVKYAAKKTGKTFIDISPYSFRHQKSADLKKELHNPGKIATFMGHRTERMQRHYGFRSQGKGSTGVMYVKATNEPKQDKSPKQ